MGTDSPRLTVLLAPLSALVLTAGCIIVDGKDSSYEQKEEAAPQARASLAPKSGYSVQGEATFTQRDGGVVVELSVRYATPGLHAVHIHEEGDCSAPDASSAGGHFNPGGHKHGAPHAAEHHLGDLGNMLVQENGQGYHIVFMPGLSILPGTNGIRNKALIIHEGPDDLTSQPSGAAGARIACGVIR